MRQINRQFDPDIVVIPMGGSVTFPQYGPESFITSFHSRTKELRPGKLSEGRHADGNVPEPGIIYVNCRLHPNMAGVVVVAPNQWYAKADRDGQYALRDLPPGTWSVVAWHKTTGLTRKEVRVVEGRDSVLDFLVPIDVSPKGDSASDIEHEPHEDGSEITLRFRTRAFLYCFAPFALLLAGSFWMIQNLCCRRCATDCAHHCLRTTKAVARMRSKSDLQNSQFLGVVGENAALKAGVQLMLANPENADARRTVEESAARTVRAYGVCIYGGLGPPPPEGTPGGGNAPTPLAGVLRSDWNRETAGPESLSQPRGGLTLLNGLPYRLLPCPSIRRMGTSARCRWAKSSISRFSTRRQYCFTRGMFAIGNRRCGIAGGAAAMSHCAGTEECQVRARVNYIR